MATDRFPNDDDRTPPPPAQKSWMKSCLLGCLAIAVVLAIIGTIATIWIARNWRDWVATAAAEGLNQGIEASELSAEEKAQIKSEVDRVIVGFRAGNVSTEQVGKIIEGIVNSPLMTAIIASVAEAKYVDKSGLSPEEKAEAEVTLQRFARGVIDDKINDQTTETVFSQIATKDANGQWKFRDNVSDDELRTFLEDAKNAADAAQIPQEQQKFDPSDEIKRVIDQALNGPAVEVPPLEIPAQPESLPAEPAA